MKRNSSDPDLSFRVPMPVTQARLFPHEGLYPVCPRCHISMEREYQKFCAACGQCLAWKRYKKAEILPPSLYPSGSPGK